MQPRANGRQVCQNDRPGQVCVEERVLVRVAVDDRQHLLAVRTCSPSLALAQPVFRLTEAAGRA